MGTAPCGSTEYNLHLLTARETSHGVVADELGFETKVGEVLLNLAANERAKHTEALSFAGIDFDDLLLVTALNELVARQPDVLGGGHVLEGDLIFVRLLQLLAVGDLVDDALLAFDNDDRTFLHFLLLFGADDAVGFHQLLDIFTSLVTPEHVLERSLVQMLLDVMEL